MPPLPTLPGLVPVTNPAGDAYQFGQALMRNGAYWDALGLPVKSAGGSVDPTDLATRADVEAMLSGSGSVPSPDPGEVNYVLTVTGAGVFGWRAFLTAWISDATAYMRDMLTGISDAVGLRGEVLTTDPADVGKVAAPNGGGTDWGWQSFLTDWISDATAYMRTLLKTIDDGPELRTAIGAASSTTFPAPANPGDNGKVLTAAAGVGAWTAIPAQPAASEGTAGVIRVVDAATLAAGADDTEAITAAKLAGSKYNVIGKQSFLIPASGLIPHPSAGPSLVTVATANGQIYRALRFADGVTSSAGIPIPLPKKVDVTVGLIAKLRFTAGAGGNVRWQVQARAVSDGDAIDGTMGASVLVTSTITANTQEVTAELALGIPTGIAKQDTLYLQVARIGADGADSLAAVADLLTFELLASIDKGNDV
jgi:hypothetical protein